MNRRKLVIIVLMCVVVIVGSAFCVLLGLRKEEVPGWTGEVRYNSVGMGFVYIPPTGDEGFRMGSPENERNRGPDERQHKVVLTKGFYLQNTEVTQEQWGALMENRRSESDGVNLPVEAVSWNDAQEFITKLNEKEGTEKYRLPTEAEWEYACRAGSHTTFYWGNKMDERYCWYGNNSNGRLHTVGEKGANAWGLFDMSGNVEEWCQDRYGEDYYGKAAQRDPKGPETGEYRVMRGGSFKWHEDYCRSANRSWTLPRLASPTDMGFRVLMEADLETSSLSPL